MLYVAFYSNRIQFRSRTQHGSFIVDILRFSSFSPLRGKLFDFSFVDSVPQWSIIASCWLTLIGSITEKDVSFKRERMEYFHRENLKLFDVNNFLCI